MLQQFEIAQRKTITLLQSVLMDMKEGQQESFIDVMVRQRALEMGFNDWLTPPVIAINGGVIHSGTLIQFRLQPVSDNAFGSIEYSLNFGQTDSRIVERAKELCIATCTFANFGKCVGELFVFAQSWANNNCGHLTDDKKIGHICFGKENRLRFMWPRGMRVLTNLRRYQVQWYNPRRMTGIYTINPGFSKDGRNASFGEMIYIEEGVRKIVGRDSLDQIGVF